MKKFFDKGSVSFGIKESISLISDKKFRIERIKLASLQVDDTVFYAE